MLAALAAAPAGPIQLAIPTLNTFHLEDKAAEFYGEQLAQQLNLQRGFQVSTQKEISTVLGLDRQKLLLGCAETSCAAELAGALGVDGVVTGTIARLGTGYSLNLKIVDPRRARPLSIISERVPTEEAMVNLIDWSAKKIAYDVRAALRPNEPNTEPPPRTSIAASAAPVPAASVEQHATPSSGVSPWIPGGIGVALLAGAAAPPTSWRRP